MGELPFALAPEAALGAWLREAEREMEPHRTAGTYRGFDGTELPWQAVHADRPRAHVVLLHGFTEFPEKYRELCRYLRQAGCTVWLPVLRGHGQGGIVHVDRFEDYVRDIACFLRDIVPERPLLFGHSMGGGVAARLLQERPDCAARAVLCSPMLCPQTCRAPHWLALGCARMLLRRGEREKSPLFSGAYDPNAEFSYSGCTSRPVSAPPWTAAQSVLLIRRWARRTAGSMNRLPCAAGSSARAPAAGAAAGIPRRKARAVQRRKCRLGGVSGRSSGIFRPDGRIRKGRDKMTLLIVVDMQNDFVTGALGTAEAQAIVPHVNAKIAAADAVVYTLDTHGEDYLATQEGKRLPVPHCIRGTWGHALADGLTVRAEAGRIEKPTFGSTALGELVRSRFAAGEIDRVELVGLCTDICVISNALLCKAFCPELPVSVDAACCAGVTPENHRNALSAMQCCQIDVLNIAPDAK